MEVKTNTELVPFESILDEIQGKKDDSKPKKGSNFFSSNFSKNNNTDLLTEIKDDEEEEGEEEVDKKDKNKPEPKGDKPEDEIKDSTDFLVGNEKRDANQKTLESDDIDKLYRELVKREALVGYSDDKPVTTIDEIYELIEENKKIEREKVITEELPQFIGSLPEEVQALVKYTAEGGKDIKSMFKALLDVEEFKQVEVTEENTKAQEDVVYKYLKAVRFAKGNDTKIQEQIEEWKDNGTLFKKAKEFKVDLDEMHEQLVAQKLQEQEQRAKEEIKREEKLKNEVYESIVKDNDLNGIKLDKVTQEKLFVGLTKKGWKSQDGKDVNLLEALIEYYKVHKPNHKLLGEALYLLMEPDNYRKKVSTEIKKDAHSDTMRKLKTEEARKNGSTVTEERQGIKRKANNNFWK